MPSTGEWGMETMLQRANYFQGHLAQNAIILKSTTRQSRTAQKPSCAKSSKNATVFKTETLIHKFQCSIGYSMTFFAACVHCVCCWSLDTLETYHSEILWEQCWRWNLTLDHWTLGQVLLSSSTGLKEHLQRHIFLMAKLDSLLHVHTTARTNTKALVVLYICWKKTMRSIICCPIFELPDRMRCNSIPLSARSWPTGLDGWGVIVFNISLQDFLISTQIAKMPENIWSRPSIIPEKILGAFPQHPQSKKCPCPRSCCCSMRICSRIFSAQPGIAFPSKSPMPCWPRHGWISYHFFVPPKIENQKIPKSKESQWHHPVHC